MEFARQGVERPASQLLVTVDHDLTLTPPQALTADIVIGGKLAASNFWKLDGNPGANPTNGSLLGANGSLPLELRVNTNRAPRLEFAYHSLNGYGPAPNVLAGVGNSVPGGVAGRAPSVPTRKRGDRAEACCLGAARLRNQPARVA